MRFLIATVAVLLVALTAHTASGEPGDRETTRGRYHARKGNCKKAIPLLEKAEELRHRPSSAEALAGCYAERGQLIKASELQHMIAAQKRSFKWDYHDVVAWRRASDRADALDARIPTVVVEPDKPYEALEVEIDGEPIEGDLSTPRMVLPAVDLVVSARAKGHLPIEKWLKLKEGERYVYALHLETEGPGPDSTDEPQPMEPDSVADSLWLGTRLRGLIIPKFMMNVFGEGGATMFAPSGGITLTTATAGPDLTFSIAYAYFPLGETPYKPNDTPDTEYEIIESDLMSLAAAMDVMWNVPLDDAGSVRFRVGASIGVGWTFYGDLTRTQAYPSDGQPGDPDDYQKCAGPNDPPGSFRYCNQLDKDADHYNNFSEPSWFEGGASPQIYPWVVLPQIGLAWHVGEHVVLDLEAGLSTSGFMTGLGFRHGI